MSGKTAYEAAKMVRTAIALYEAITEESSPEPETPTIDDSDRNYDLYDAKKDSGEAPA